MALITCPECGKEISDASEKCIYCGYPLKTVQNQPTKKRRNVILAVVITAAVLICVAVVVTLILLKQNGKKTCKAAGCSERVYSDGYCIDHYGQSRNGQEVDEKATTDINSLPAGEGIDEDVEETIPFNKDTKMVTESCEFTLKGYKIANKIEPENCKSTYYSYFEAASGNVFIDVKFSIKNKANKDIEQADILNSVKIIYDGEYEYSCSFVTVDKDGDFENFTTLYSISPLETMEYHMLAEVPNEVKNSNGSLVCRVDADGTIYECKLR